MAKVSIKSEKITPFGGIFHVREFFFRYVGPVIDEVLGLRCTSYGYQYSEIAGSLSSVYFCGGDCVEDVTSHLMPHLSLHPTLRTCSSDTILRGISELATVNTTYTSDTGKSYDFNTATKLNSLLALRAWKREEINGIGYELNSIITEKWEGKAYRLVIQRQRRADGEQDLWEGEYTYRCILTNDYTSTCREIVEFYNLRGGKERIFDDMNNGFGWTRLPKSFMAENTVFLLLTALIRNFYKFLMGRLDTKAFGLKKTSLNCALRGGQTCYGYTEGRTAGGVTWGTV